ncbi:hypothetical protein E2562_034513 [Oryza meyeriana var. granulata]|uniref:Uncharacterized protein n=1 Tax=Oryza meyeriana var. granulata TaxID=110450 RepID=A0A6G1CWC6_9ORYZ|nr:hypothetical protein E2562_034513 [Oryza meyeriana var. granulata]
MLSYFRESARAAVDDDTGAGEQLVKELCSSRGRGVLKKLRGELTQQARARPMFNYDTVMESVTMSGFDESLLLWHIAKDLCLFRHGIDMAKLRVTSNSTDSDRLICRSTCCTCSSRSRRMEMTSATLDISQLLYRNTVEVARQVSLDAADAGWDVRRDRLRDTRQSLLKMSSRGGHRDRLLDGDRTEMRDTVWNVVAAVWTEMLIFAAARTQASEHLRQLSHGGELVTLEPDNVAKLVVYDQ